MFDDLVGFLEDRSTSWSAWDYKDLGVLGLARRADDTPWARFQAREEIQRIRSDAYAAPSKLAGTPCRSARVPLG